MFIDPLGGTDYSLIVCLTSQSLNRTTNEIDAASKCGPDTQPGDQTIDISFEGQKILDLDTDRISIGDLHDLWAAKTTVGWKYGPATPVSDDVSYSGTGWISSLEETDAHNETGSFSATLRPYGSITKTVTA